MQTSSAPYIEDGRVAGYEINKSENKQGQGAYAPDLGATCSGGTSRFSKSSVLSKTRKELSRHMA